MRIRGLNAEIVKSATESSPQKSHTHSSEPWLALGSKEPEEKDKSEKCFVMKVNVEILQASSSSIKIPSASNNDFWRCVA